MDNQLKTALKEIDNANQKYDVLYREFSLMKLYSNDLENQIKSLKLKLKTKSTLNNNTLTEDANAAMKRYTNKLRKEAEQYAKQKQS